MTDYWMPGDSLLHSSPRFPPCDMHSSPIVSPQTSSNSEILDALKGMQEGVESKVSTIVEKLDTACDRLVVLENWQKGTEEDIRASASSSSSASPRTPIPGKRCRRTPPALQVCTHTYTIRQLSCNMCEYLLQNKIRVVHSSFAMKISSTWMNRE